MKRFLATLSVLLLLSTLGCDSADVVEPTFSVAVSGALNTSFDGEPEADRDVANLPDGQLTNYDFYFQGERHRAEFSISTLDEPIAEGTYPILRWGSRGPGEAIAALYANTGTDDFRHFRSIGGGTVEITRASGDHVQGRFEFSGRDSDAIPPDTVRVTGEFEVRVVERNS